VKKIYKDEIQRHDVNVTVIKKTQVFLFFFFVIRSFRILAQIPSEIEKVC
jgi:hypothetical protein